MNYSLGCSPSKLDGTEKIINDTLIDEIPESFDWNKIMPPVRDQGQSSTCVCQSLTGVLDFYYNKTHNQVKVCNNFSIDELYSIRANKNAEGMTIKEALNYLRHHGLNNYKINGYAMIKDAEIMKQCLFMYGPCVGGFMVYLQKDDPTERYFWKPSNKSMGGHCITFTGYDKDNIIIRNSWGTKWADNGYVKIPCKDFNKYCFESWSVTL